jgi:hypothetical protein
LKFFKILKKKIQFEKMLGQIEKKTIRKIKKNNNMKNKGKQTI